MAELIRVSKVMLEANGIYFIECPGCKYMHPIHVGEQHRIRWGFNNNVDKPTFTPSLLVNSGTDQQCHSFITDGKIQFLNDCVHELAGQNVELPEIEDFT